MGASPRAVRAFRQRAPDFAEASPAQHQHQQPYCRRERRCEHRRDGWRIRHFFRPVRRAARGIPKLSNAGSVAWLARNQLLLKAVQAVRSQMERLAAEALTANGKEVNYRWALSFGTCFDIANPHWGPVCIPELMLQFVGPCLGMGIAREVHALAHPAAINVI